jgi:phenylalanyl-tRNA synthetase beta chain
MLASYNWLKELCPGLTLSAKEVADKLTGAGLEVESQKPYGAPDECIVVKVVSMRPHPTKSGLRLVTVDTGSGTQEIVCGAPNVPDPGGLLVLAPLNTHLPAKNMTIGKRDIGGIPSEGMLCSDSELGLSEESDGIIILKDGKPGQPFTQLFPRDVIFEIGLTPNRPDGLGHIGLARELAALVGLHWKPPFVVETEGRDTIELLGAKVTVEDGTRCPLYAAAGAIGVTVGPSPDWVKYRLESLGVRAISNVVDVTNLVMLETGHPMHAFDYDQVQDAHIVVRRARENDVMVTLDGVSRQLSEDDLLICDGRGPVALAGVMGGKDSEIGPRTTRVLFECAYFDARGVRRSGRRHGLHTESSHRFERGVDWDDHAYVLARATDLTARLSHGAKALAGHIVVHGDKLSRKVIRLRHAKIKALLGVDVPMAEALATLTRLGCVITSSSAGNEIEADVEAPSHRPDLLREVDLIEEIIRVRGIDTVPAELPAVRPTRDVGGREAAFSRVREAAVSVGLSEAVTFAFTTKESLAKLHAPTPSVTLKNPLSELQAVMRTSMLAGLIDALGNARRHGERSARLFTLGSTYEARAEASELRTQADNLPVETPRFAALLAGDAPAYLQKPRAVDVWDALGIAEELVFRVTGVRADLRRDKTFAHLHPRGSAAIYVHDALVGRVGPLHPDVLEAFDLGSDVVVVELDVMALAKAQPVRCVPLPRFPKNTRDIALVVSDDVSAGDVLSGVKKAAGELCEEVSLFDRFTGESIPKEHASLAFRVVYRSKDKTLTDAEVDAVHTRVIAEVNAAFGAKLRA